jgi:hypothetical protein
MMCVALANRAARPGSPYRGFKPQDYCGMPNVCKSLWPKLRGRPHMSLPRRTTVGAAVIATALFASSVALAGEGIILSYAYPDSPKPYLRSDIVLVEPTAGECVSTSDDMECETAE